MNTPDENNRNSQPIDFEKELKELEQVIARLEERDLPLEESIKQFEQGMGLLRNCQQALDRAEQKVRFLTGNDHNFQLESIEKKGKKHNL